MRILTLGLAGLLLVVFASRPALAQTAPPSADTGDAISAALDQTPESAPPSSLWSTRNLLLVAGFGSAVAASVVAWRDNSDLARRKAALEALPPTAIDQWNADFSAAKLVEGSRDFWRSVAIGLGAVSAGYWITSSRDIGPFGIGPGRVSVKLPKKGWVVQVDPLSRHVALSGSF